MRHWRQGIDPTAKHKARAAVEEKKMGYANSAEQIEEWYKDNSARNKKIESLVSNLSNFWCTY